MQAILRLGGLLLGLGWLGTVTVPGAQAMDHLIRDIVPRPLASALSAARSGDWDKAASIAARDGKVAEDLILWTRLRSGAGRPDEILAFLDSNAHWPGLDYLRRQSEPAFDTASDAQVLEFFDGRTPQTGKGALRHALALAETGQVGEAEATIVLAWRTLDLDAAEHDAFIARYGTLLQPHHAARLSQSIWEGRSGDITRMIEIVGGDQARLARARLALKGQDAGVDALIDALPEAMKDDPGLAYDRFTWRVAKGLRDDAKQLLLEQSRIPNGLGYPEDWANHRRSYAREEMRTGSAERAYEMAANHQLTEGGSFADLEWLAGYIALRYLKQPEVALTHFVRLQARVQTPISLGRAGYWRGRALEALGRQDEAGAAYRAGGDQQTTFYGLLAAEKAGIPFDQSLAGQMQGKRWQETTLARSDLRAAVMMLRAAGVNFEAERFLRHMAETATMEELLSLGRMVEEAGDPHLEVMLGKEAAQRGIVLPRHYYALHPMVEQKLPIATEMALAIARRESEFDPSVTSQVGARGLMQLMPRTAQAMAQKIGDSEDVAARLGQWPYNARLGSAYLAQLARDFNGNVMLVSVGYNAGPSRAESWRAINGDPSLGGVDPVDWVEHIPFRETRNYVQRVAESLPIYRARLGKPPLPVPFTTELMGSTLTTFAPQGE
ncbi:lytic transglycosylase domain-containing protein [Pseudooceanicola onchidii]|uniref:lytic transglycosylase domain-containing protein n=1 Tax=Pseudooceanicola onchidii TaxID=2562279 RepID=UPI0010AB3461|nr:lytic transglycosylase domain-containing protein [Pseudooceanicola onchidii]